jgi:hypothetical protein
MIYTSFWIKFVVFKSCLHYLRAYLKKYEFLDVLEFIMIPLKISVNDIFIFMDINTMFIILQHKIHDAL